MAVIRNVEQLATSDARRDALAIAEAGYAAVDVGAAFSRQMRVEQDELVIGDEHFPLAERRVFFVGVGKCSVAAAHAVEKILGDKLTAGIALDVRGVEGGRLKKVRTFVGTHPKPTQANVDAAREVVTLLGGCEENDLVLMLISGGGSTLLCLHDAPMTCLDEGMLFDALTEKGASIQELNTVRKHISKVRGGGLAAAAYPAQVVALIISDVPGNDIQFIASGPTVNDASTIEDAKAVLARYGIPEPPGGFLETPKEEKYFARVTNILFLTNRTALEAMAKEASMRGYEATIVDDTMHGEAHDLARAVVERLHAAPPKTVQLYGGESTVTLPAVHGPGGRSEELALAALRELQPGELILSFASDGRDATDHAGAIADEETNAHVVAHGVSIEDALARRASFDFFEATGDALVTGLLESNVSDLLIALKK